MIRMIRIHGVKKALTYISVKLVTHAVVSKWRGIYHAYIVRCVHKKLPLLQYPIFLKMV